jgi:hypothetical protein
MTREFSRSARRSRLGALLQVVTRIRDLLEDRDRLVRAQATTKEGAIVTTNHDEPLSFETDVKPDRQRIPTGGSGVRQCGPVLPEFRMPRLPTMGVLPVPTGARAGSEM